MSNGESKNSIERFFNIAGISHNWVRETPPCVKAKMSNQDDALKDIPKMDLMNFEDPEFEDSKYVLTSPRSLEACSRLGVKPVDLLYKPLAEFQEELLPQDVPLRTIYNIYDEHEQNRERKLALCREERQRIMDEEKGKPPSKSKPVVVKSKRGALIPGKLQTRKAKLGKKVLSKSDQELNKASMQRQRTAWATSVGHERITNDEINHRVKELHDESLKLRKELLVRKEARATSRKKKTKSAPVSSTAAISRSYSASDLSLAGTSLLHKTNIGEARPITSRKLKKALSKSTQDLKAAAITPRDQKILELMMSKAEDSKAQNRESFLRELIWERQKKEEEAARVASEMRRRRMLAEENRTKNQKRSEQDAQRLAKEKWLREEQKKYLEEDHKRWAARFEAQKKTKDLRSAEKVEKESLKKRIQESNVKTLENDEEEMKDLVRQSHDHAIMTAAQRKQAKLLEESMKVMMQNRNERRTFEDRWNSILRDTQKSIDVLTESMNMKDSKHRSKYDQIMLRREQELTLNRLDREKKALQAKLSQQQHENEMEEWRDSIMTSREFAEQHARETLAQSIERKARKAHLDRVKKEKEQKRNIRKIHEEVEAWKKHTENTIESKDKKSEVVQREKELTIQQSRNLAAASQKLRDSLRNKYGGESFDQKVHKAELYNKLGSSNFTSEKNSSNVKLR